MEGVGGGAAILEFSKAVVQVLAFLHKVKNAAKQQRQLLTEVDTLLPVLEGISSLVQEIEDNRDDHGILQRKQSHAEKHLPIQLESLRTGLEGLTTKLSSRSLKSRLTWPLDEKKCRDVMISIDRMETHAQTIIIQDLHKVSSKTKNLMSTMYQDYQRQTIMASLTTLNFTRSHRSIFAQAMRGTGQWFLTEQRFCEWKTEPGTILWCPGIPGAGKTVLSSIVVEHLRETLKTDPQSLVLYVYCNYRASDRQTLDNILNDLLTQVLNQRRTHSKIIFNSLAAYCMRGESLVTTELLQVLSSATMAYERIFVVVDALDELDERVRSVLIKQLNTIQPQMNLLLTFRPDTKFRGLPSERTILEIEAQDTDLESYVRARIEQDDQLCSMSEDDDTFAQQVVEIVLEKAQNMFLLAQLYMTTIADQLTVNDALKQLKSLPDSLDSFYEDALQRIQALTKPRADLAIKVLVWLCFAMRPLTLAELRHALSVQPNQQKFDRGNLIQNESDITGYCAGLVVVEGTDQISRLVHYSAQEFLREHLPDLCYDRFGMEPHLLIAETCLTYLSFEDLQPELEWQFTLTQYPFAAYAARQWGRHYSQILEPPSHFQDLAFGLLQRETRPSDKFLTNPIDKDEVGSYPVWPPLNCAQWENLQWPCGMHIAAHFGLPELVIGFIHIGVDPDAADFAGDTALHWAAWNGHTAVVEALLERGADPSPLSGVNRATPIQLAAVSGQIEVVKILLHYGADINAWSENGFGSPPLSEAIHHNHIDLVKFLLDHGADINQCIEKHEKKLTPLKVACEQNRPECAQILLERGAFAEVDDVEDLIDACVGGSSTQTLKLIVEKIEGKTDNTDTPVLPLEWAMNKEHGNVIELLLREDELPELSWSPEQDKVQQWKDEPWFDKLLTVCVG